MIVARYDIILDQLECAHLYNHLSNYANNVYHYSVYMYLSAMGPLNVPLFFFPIKKKEENVLLNTNVPDKWKTLNNKTCNIPKIKECCWYILSVP